jgi:hypothetical protein
MQGNGGFYLLTSHLRTKILPEHLNNWPVLERDQPLKYSQPTTLSDYEIRTRRLIEEVISEVIPSRDRALDIKYFQITDDRI